MLCQFNKKKAEAAFFLFELWLYMVGCSVWYKNVPDLYFPKYVVVVPLLGRNKTKHYFQVQLFLLTPEVTWIVIVVYCSTYSRYIVFVVIVVVSLLPEKNQEI